MDATISDPLMDSVERTFETLPLPGIWQQVTLRSMATSTVLGVVFCYMVLTIQMKMGMVPQHNMPMSVLSFVVLKWLVALLRTLCLGSLPFSRQENLLVLTTINTSLILTMAGGFSSYIIGMSSVVAKTLGEEHPNSRDIVDYVPIWHRMLFIFLIGIAGILLTLSYSQVMILEYRLLFPTGTVQAHLLNSFHTPEGAYVAKIQAACIFKFFLGSFSWSLFTWFYASGNGCGFSSFPLFGLGLYKHRFFFDFSTVYVGIGMICPHIVNFGLLFGGIISSGFFVPFLETKIGQWYQTESTTSLAGTNGYKVFIAVTMIVTDGLFHVITMLIIGLVDFNQKRRETDSVLSYYLKKHPSLNYDDRKRIEVFVQHKIPIPITVAGYVACAAICVVAIPWIFDQIKFYHVAALYTILPVLSFCDTYVSGLTDWVLAYTYAKFIVFVMAAWVAEDGAIVASLVACGVVVAGTDVAGQSMQDFKTAYMTLTSQKAMAIGQIFGVVISSVVSPLIVHGFQLTTAKTNIPIGSPESPYPCPYAGLYRAIAMIGKRGLKDLPHNCIQFCMIGACLAVAINAISFVSRHKGWVVQHYIPSVTVMTLPLFIGPNVPIDLCVGSVVMYIWTRRNVGTAMILSTAVAAGLITGGAMFQLPEAIFSLFQVQPPMCMKFFPSGKQVDKVDAFLNNVGTTTKT